MGSATNRMLNGNALKLGIFSPNCSGGMAVTTVPERWDASWDNNAELARMADAAGIEFLLPIARWRGYGGETNFQGTNLETVTWATAMLAVTDGITVFCTAHTSFHHPIVMAKMMATADQVSHGRLGLNVVCGWNQPEYHMFGRDLPDSHDERYAYGQEWLDVVRRIWTAEDEFDWHGRFFRLNRSREPKVNAKPRPSQAQTGNAAPRCGVTRCAAPVSTSQMTISRSARRSCSSRRRSMCLRGTSNRSFGNPAANRVSCFSAPERSSVGMMCRMRAGMRAV